MDRAGLGALIFAAFLALAGPARASEHGIASVYDEPGCVAQQKPHGGCVRFDPRAFTAAHRTLPFGAWVQVTNERNGRTVRVRINDRGPFVRGRIIDLTPAAAEAIGIDGLAPVTVQ